MLPRTANKLEVKEHTHARPHTTVQRPFVRDYPVPEETFTHSHPSFINFLRLLQSTVFSYGNVGNAMNIVTVLTRSCIHGATITDDQAIPR